MTKKPHVLSDRFTDPDLVDRIFDYLAMELAHVIQPGGNEAMRQAKAAVRAEFGASDKVYVRRSDSPEEHPKVRAQRRVAQTVLAMFNGRNATTLARELKIGRATVYRILKQAGKSTPEQE